MNNDLSLTPAQTMAHLTVSLTPQLVTDEAFEGLCEAYFRTGNKLLYVLADQLIHAENGYAQAMRSMRQEGDLLPANHERREVQGPIEGQV